MEHQEYRAAQLMEQSHYKAKVFEMRAKAGMWICFGISSVLVAVALFVQV